MKWVRFEHEGRELFGWLRGDTVMVSDLSWGEILRGTTAEPSAELRFDEVRLLNPVGRPGKIIAIGLNYLDHIRETGLALPEKPLIFTKFSSSVQDPFGEIIWSPELTAVDRAPCNQPWL